MKNEQTKRPAGLIWVMILVAAEGLVIGGLAIWLAIALITGGAKSLVTSLALLVLVAAAAGWLNLIVRGLLRGKRWARSAALFWQLVQLAVASGSFSGQFGSQAIGWALIVPSVVVLVLLFTKPVVAATMAATDEERA